MTRAAILARVSTASQAEADRMSLPMQRERIERFAAERNRTVTVYPGHRWALGLVA